MESAVGSAAGTNPSTGSVVVYPSGGVPSGDGTTDGRAAPLLGRESPPAAATASPPAPEAVLETVGALSYSPPVGLRIPTIGVTSGFVAVGLDAAGTLEVPQAADLVGWYTDAPTPGERGPAVATAHVDWKHKNGVFHDLARVQPGNDVIIKRADGLSVTFRVNRVEEYPKTQFPVNEVYGSTAAAELRLITCGGRFDDKTNSYDDNVVVYASMIGVA
ncbi:MAG: class F sortase [Pseudonocardia sp.]|nr:class F sortase [Pseudonocardia sp.]